MIGTIGYVMVAEFSAGLLWFNVMSVILGLGFTFYSGAVDAWLVDALHETGFKGELDHDSHGCGRVALRKRGGIP